MSILRDIKAILDPNIIPATAAAREALSQALTGRVMPSSI